MSGSAISIYKRVESRSTFLDLIKRDKWFLVLVAVGFFLAGVLFPYPQYAMWLGFMLAGYSTIANDSIQTIGTFLASNKQRPWWVLWLFIGGIFVFTILFSWFVYDGDVTYQRLAAKGFAQTPTSFTFLQVAAPLFLLVLTRLRMPVSTTFLILSCFATEAGAIGSVLLKSVSGYGLAFVVAITIWWSLSKVMDRLFTGTASKIWIPLQWASTGFLWSGWITQDAANIAVYLPRQLGTTEVAFFIGFIFLGLGLLFFLRGDRIQEIVNEKTDVVDVRYATVIDFIYGLLLFYFKGVSNIPMSTTWVFIGLLAGREIGIRMARHGRPDRRTFKMMGRDLGAALIGLVVSIILAVAANPNLLD